MNERLVELIDQSTWHKGPNGDTEFDKEYFAKLIVAECSEMVRGVLREEGSTLSYKDAGILQERFKEAFDIEPNWSEP